MLREENRELETIRHTPSPKSTGFSRQQIMVSGERGSEFWASFLLRLQARLPQFLPRQMYSVGNRRMGPRLEVCVSKDRKYPECICSRVNFSSFISFHFALEALKGE